MKIELTQAVIECLKRGLNCWPQQNFADGAEIRDILRMNLRLVEALASQEPLATTHYAGCYDGGQKHYECALLEVKRLRDDMNKDEMLESILHSLERIEAKQNKPWVDLTVDEATIIWERVVEERDGWELIMQVQQALKEKNGG